MAQHSDQTHCAQMVRTHDRDRWLTVALAPAASRGRLEALYALNLEIARIQELASEPMAGRVRLQWWRESLNAAGGGRVRDHPVLRAIAPFLQGGQISNADLEEFLGAREREFEAAGFEDMKTFKEYCRSTGGVLCRMAAHMLGAAGAAPLAAAESVGTAYAMVGQLRNTAWAAGRGRVLLPMDLLAAYGVPVGHLLSGTPGDGLKEVAREIAGLAGLELSAARGNRHNVPRIAVTALLISRAAATQIRHLERNGFDLFSPAAEPSPLTTFLAVLRGAVTGRF